MKDKWSLNYKYKKVLEGEKVESNIKTEENYIKKLNEFIRKNKINYIYGAGKIAKKTLSIIEYPERIEGIVISSNQNAEQKIEDYSIVHIEDLDFSDDIGIIIALNYSNTCEVISKIRSLNVSSVFFAH